MTEEEKRDAELHHSWVYSFLHRHNYSIEEFYDVAIMGYLRGVQDYHRKPNAQKHGMSVICERAMLNEMATYFRDQNRLKRKPQGGFVSIDAHFDDSNETFVNSIITTTLEEDFFEEYDREHESERIKKILSQLTDTQRKIVILKANGKKHQYIAKKLGITESTISRELKKIKSIVSTQEDYGVESKKHKKIKSITEYIGVSTEVILTLKLSARQLDVINLLMIGYKESDIGRELGISRQAVYDAVKKIRAKASRL